MQNIFLTIGRVRTADCISFLSVGIGALGACYFVELFKLRKKSQKALHSFDYNGICRFVLIFVFGSGVLFLNRCRNGNRIFTVRRKVGTWEIIRISTCAFFSFAAVLFLGFMYYVAAPNINCIDKNLRKTKCLRKGI